MKGRRLALAGFLLATTLVIAFSLMRSSPKPDNTLTSTIELNSIVPASLEPLPDDEVTIDVDAIPLEQSDDPECVAPGTEELADMVARVRAELDEAAIVLSTKKSADSLVVAAMLTERDKAGAVELLKLATTLDPGNKIAWWRLLSLCRTGNEYGCEPGWVQQSAISADADNAALWLAVAGQRISAGDEMGAARAARQFISAPKIDVYIADQVSLLDRELSASTALSFQERILLASDDLAATIPGLSALAGFCGRSGDVSWQDLCLQIGTRLATDSGDVGIRRDGLRLQRLAAERRGDAGILQEIEAQDQRYREFEEFADPSDMKALNLLLSDEAVLRTFLQNLESSGEIVAFETLKADVERLEETPGYDACNLEVNPFVKL